MISFQTYFLFTLNPSKYRIRLTLSASCIILMWSSLSLRSRLWVNRVLQNWTSFSISSLIFLASLIFLVLLSFLFDFEQLCIFFADFGWSENLQEGWLSTFVRFELKFSSRHSFFLVLKSSFWADISLFVMKRKLFKVLYCLFDF